MSAEHHQLPHQPSQAKAVSTLQDSVLYFCPFQQNPGVVKRANKQNKTKANKKKKQYLLKMLRNTCTNSVNVCLKFPACPAVQMPKDNGFISPNIGEYFLWLCFIRIIIPHAPRFRPRFEKDMPGDHFTYLL